MSRDISAQLAAAGETIEEALEQLAQHSDVGAQLFTLNAKLTTEKVLADHRHETLCLKLDEVNAKLDSIAALLKVLTANGSGGAHV